jgi:hypothetical protein
MDIVTTSTSEPVIARREPITEPTFRDRVGDAVRALWHMLASPLTTLAGLRREPHVLLPLVTAALYATVASYYVIQRIGIRRVVEASVRATAGVDPEAVVESAMVHKDQILAMQAAGSFFGTFIAVLGLSVIYWLIVTAFGADVTYRRIAAVVANVMFFVTCIKQTMIVGAVTLSRNPSMFNMKEPLATNLAFFLHSGSRVIEKLLTSCDIIVLSGLALTIFGLLQVSDRLSVKASAAAVLIPWAIYLGGAMAMPALS